jgi:hypothetical protein
MPMRAALTKDSQSTHSFGEEIRTRVMHGIIHGAGSAKRVLRVSPNREQHPMVHYTADTNITHCTRKFLVNIGFISY